MLGGRLRSSADGWRGLIGADFTPDSAAALARCVVAAVRSHAGAAHPVSNALVVHDGRRLGAAAAGAVVRAVRTVLDGPVWLVPHLPTPTATAAVRLEHADLALLITASHNPPSWNGLKVKVRPGCPPPSTVERAVAERYAAWRGGRTDEPAATATGDVAGAGTGMATGAGPWQRDLVADHIEAVLAAPARPPGHPGPPGPPGKGLRVVVDGLGGVAAGPMARLCEALGWTVHRVGDDLDPDFNGLVPDPTLPSSRTRAVQAVVERGADLGLVLDGDGDRIFAIDHRGWVVHPHELLALLIEHRHRASLGDPLRGVAVTTSTGMAVRRVAEWIGAPVREFGVGFKHLAPALLAEKADAAGGSVGDLAFAEFGCDRDPFVAVALLAGLLADGGTLAERADDLRARVGPLTWFEMRVPDPLPGSVPGWAAGPALLRRAGLAALSRVGLWGDLTRIEEIDGVKFWLDHGQWLLLRPSSTEGGVRIYGELKRISATELGTTIQHYLSQQCGAQ
jgi:phosphomannomutase